MSTCDIIFLWEEMNIIPELSSSMHFMFFCFIWLQMPCPDDFLLVHVHAVFNVCFSFPFGT